MGNTASNVAAGKPKTTGSIYRAPLGTELPTDATTALASAYICAGYVSDAGVVNSKTREAAEIKAWGGDTVLNPQTSKKDTFKFTLIESKNTEVLKIVHGDANVTGALKTGLTLTENSNELDAAVYIIDMILNGTFKRIVIPNGQPTEIGDVEYKDDSAVAYPVTLTAYPHAGYNGATHKEFLQDEE